MSKEEHIHFTGTVIKQLVAGKYQVKVKLGDGDS
jgi:translation initiation factor IF-1